MQTKYVGQEGARDNQLSAMCYSAMSLFYKLQLGSLYTSQCYCVSWSVFLQETYFLNLNLNKIKFEVKIY